MMKLMMSMARSKSLIKITNRQGPRQLPWIIEDTTSPQLLTCPFRTTLCFLHVSHSSIHLITLPQIPSPQPFPRSLLWGTTSYQSLWWSHSKSRSHCPFIQLRKLFHVLHQVSLSAFCVQKVLHAEWILSADSFQDVQILEHWITRCEVLSQSSGIAKPNICQNLIFSYSTRVRMIFVQLCLLAVLFEFFFGRAQAAGAF